VFFEFNCSPEAVVAVETSSEEILMNGWVTSNPKITQIISGMSFLRAPKWPGIRAWTDVLNIILTMNTALGLSFRKGGLFEILSKISEYILAGVFHQQI
jgi:hypothetical protein